MESRMEKYHDVDIDDFQRSKKNADLYKKVYGNYDDFENLPIPDNINGVEIENLKSLADTRSSKRKELIESQNFDLEEESSLLYNEEKVYDINTLLEIAKEENAKIKKENIVNKTIPNYLVNLESDKTTRDIISKYDGDIDDDLPIIKEVNFIDNDSSSSNLSLDILSDLKPSGNTMVSEPLTEKIADLENEKEFFDNKVSFSKDDFDEEDDEEELFYEENNHVFLKIIIIIIGFASIFTAAYFIIKEYTNIF